MEDQKVFIILNDNGEYADAIISEDKNSRQVALATKDYLEKTNDTWLKYRIVELPLEGKIHKGHINIITTIKLNNIPIRAIANNFNNLVEIVDGYMNKENEYRKFKFHTEFIKIN